MGTAKQAQPKNLMWRASHFIRRPVMQATHTYSQQQARNFVTLSRSNRSFSKAMHTFFNGDSYTNFRKPKPFWKKCLTEARFLIPFVLLPIGGTVFTLFSIEEVKYTGRKRIIFVSKDIELSLGETVKQQILTGKMGDVVAADHPLCKTISRVGASIARANGLENGWEWEYFLVKNNQANAFVVPGGKVVVYTGLFSIVKNEDELAVILSHEIAHAVARHTAETMSLSAFVASCNYLLNTFLDVPYFQVLDDFLFKIMLTMPRSRKMESEADFIGLQLMSHACYNPNVAPSVMRRLGGSESSWLDTHPPPESRAQDLSNWLPAVQSLVDDCKSIKTMFKSSKSTTTTTTTPATTTTTTRPSTVTKID